MLASFVVGIDIGGTFTDVVAVDRETGRFAVEKVLSTPGEPAKGALEALDLVEAALGVPGFLGQVESIVHGTTVTTNAVLTRSGATTGVLTTLGFRDMLDIRTGIRDRRHLYNNKFTRPPALAPRWLRRGISGRVDKTGAVVAELDRDEIVKTAGTLVDEGATSIAVTLMHSYANEDHERMVGNVLREAFPNLDVSLSVDVSKQVRIYPRLSTTVLNAYTRPVLGDYLSNLASELNRAGFAGTLLVMQSNGGVAGVDACERLSAATLLSGPAAGPAAGAFFASADGAADAIVIDMGGTSFEAAVVRGGAPGLAEQGEIGGHLVSLPMIDIHTIGAGGGSIAWVDDGGLLQVGPHSAGALPGPACYGRGGELPTCTDADLVLGLLSPGFFLGGRIELDAEAARRAIEQHIASPLGIDVVEAAAGIFEVANLKMAAGVHEVTVQRGHDPRELTLVAAGGAGGLHGAALAMELGITKMVVPRQSSVLCALGLLLTDLKHDYSEGYPTRLEALDCERLRSIVQALGGRGTEELVAEHVPREQIEIEVRLEMRYVGQHHELSVAIPQAALQGDCRDALRQAFAAEHAALYGFALDGAEVEITGVRVATLGRRPAPRLVPSAHLDSGTPAFRSRSIHVAGAGQLEAAVMHVDSIAPGDELEGPTLVEAATTTVYIPAGWGAVCDELGSLVLTWS